MSTAQASHPHTAPSNNIALESGKDGKITHISVYPSRAHITRLFKFRLNVGQNHCIFISRLPDVVDDTSIRVEISGAASVQLQDVTISQSPTPPINEALSDEIERKNIAIKTTEKTVDALISSLASVSLDTATPDILRNIIRTIHEVSTDFDEDLINLKKGLRKLQASTSNGMWQHPEILPLRKMVSFGIFAETEQDVEVSLHYAVAQAGWTPVYDLRVDSESKGNCIQLEYKASISQRTGEDWRDVHLTLETSLPRMNANLPSLTPWKLSFSTPKYMVPMSAMPQSLLIDDVPRNAPRTMSARRSHGFSTVNFDDENPNAMATFEVTEPKTIYGNGSVHKVALAELALAGEIKWLCIPTLKDVRMYWTAQVRNESQYPLLKGPASVYMNGSYTARSEIPYVSPQERFTCALGVDPTIRVIYHPRDKKRSQSGFYTKSNNHIFEQRITVINTKSCDVDNVKVIDRIPISEESKISVKLLSPALPISEPGSEKLLVDMSERVLVSKGVFAQWDKDDDSDDGVNNVAADGKISWICSIPAQGRVNLVLSWEVSAPADKVVVGL